MTTPPRYLIGIGAQKCASTWVFDVLSRHPGVAAPARKELDFFSARFDRGYRWYAGQWPASAPCRVENSPSYLAHPAAAGRVAAFAPDARIICTLRDPVERAYSHHLHEVARGHIPPIPFEAALDANPSYLEQGHYARALRPWVDSFPDSARLCLLAEDIRADPFAAWAALLDFAGLPHKPLPLAGRGARNVSDRARSATLRHVLRSGGRALSALRLDGVRDAARNAPGLSHLLRWNALPLRQVIPPPGAALRAHLARGFAADMEQLCTMLGRDSLPWPSWQAVTRAQRYPSDRKRAAASRPAMRLPSGTGWVPSPDM
ncbi:sulfotransferase [Oceanibium sediminis]|uniref:sulfotransferase n=1 Tax=Oceanibium sediminis TaxID=2026339 RepID=UPI00130082DD|nr:sulfotransferase [Oceanibium sediminis]